MYKKLIVVFLVAMSFATMRSAAFADFDAGQFASNFNLFVNTGGSPRTPLFYMRESGPVFQATDVSDYGFNLNVGAYSPHLAGMVDPALYADYGPDIIVGTFTSQSGSTWYYYNDDLYFSSFALGSTSWLPYETVGQLNYSNGATRTSNGTAINLGTAYLYAKYATGAMGTLNTAAINELNTAFQVLLSGNITAQWTTNPFLGLLLDESGGVIEDWLIQYDLNFSSNSWLDNNYAVYVMNLTQFVLDWSGGGSEPEMRWDSVGDVLYLVRRDNGGTSAVPEPTTLFAWSVIGFGLLGAARHRKRQTAIKTQG